MVKPLQAYPIISIIAFILLLTTCILLLLVGLSLTIIKPIYLIIVKSTSNVTPPTRIATQLRFGVWGVCAYSDFDQPDALPDSGYCIGPQLGYVVPPDIKSLIDVPDGVVNAVETSLRVILILHPVAAGLALITFITSLFLASHAVSIFTLFLAIIAGILATIVFGIDLALGIIVKSQIKQLEQFQLEVEFGNGVWMVLVAVALTWIAVVFLSARACYCCGVRRKDLQKHRY